MISGLTLKQINEFFGDEIVDLTDLQKTLPCEIDYLNPSQTSINEQPGPLPDEIVIWTNPDLEDS